MIFQLCLLFLIGQLNASKQTVRLPPGKAAILQEYGGKLVELINSPADVNLPSLRTSAGPHTEWSVEIKNLGPRDVTIRGNQFAVLLHPKDLTTIAWRSSAFVRIQ